MRRTIFGCSGLFYLALALTSADIAMGASRVSENRSIREWTGWLLVQPLGCAVIAFIGVDFAAAAIGSEATRLLREPGAMQHRRRTGIRMLHAATNYP